MKTKTVLRKTFPLRPGSKNFFHELSQLFSNQKQFYENYFEFGPD